MIYPQMAQMTQMGKLMETGGDVVGGVEHLPGEHLRLPEKCLRYLRHLRHLRILLPSFK